MNAEALVGTVLGTCTLQKLIGQGGMGAVFLAQQSRPNRQVAVKVLLPLLPSSPNHQTAFLERFRRETDAAASLMHPNIMPVHEYGERDGLAYLVMPHIGGGTLREELDRDGQLPFTKIVNYLDQLAAALDVAHERGVIHRDVKPANILMTLEGRLLLSDFGLVKIIAEGQSPQRRLTGAGVPMGTPDYMAPEQVLGSEVDARADIYSLGGILYHMVTGNPPFKGEMPMQVALQHLQVPPPSPCSFRADLPTAAEQIILRALAKRPADRYMHAQDLANAFRLALVVAGIQVDNTADILMPTNVAGDNRTPYTPRGLFDPVWQKNARSTSNYAQPASPPQGTNMVSQTSQPAAPTGRNDIVAKTSMTLPSFTGLGVPGGGAFSPGMGGQQAPPVASPPRMSHTPLPPGGGSPFGYNPGMFPSMSGLRMSPSPVVPPPAPTDQPGSQEQTIAGPPPSAYNGAPYNPGIAAGTYAAAYNPGTAAGTHAATAYNPGIEPGASAASDLNAGNGGYNEQGLTGALMQPLGDVAVPGANNTVKLTQSMRLVHVPIAGQPGRYLTGLLPMPAQGAAAQNPITPSAGLPQENTSTTDDQKGTLKQHSKLVILVAIVLLVVFGSSTFWLLQPRQPQATDTQNNGAAAPSSSMGTAVLQATATAQANMILTDPLTQNVHDWHITSGGPQTYVFKNGAYHIANNDVHAAIALLPDEVPPMTFAYTLTLAELKGDNTSINNQFGMILRYNTTHRNGRFASTFYCFDVARFNPGGEYQFWKYDDSFGPDVNPWTKLWVSPIGKEYHGGYGQTKRNTFKIIVGTGKFSFVANGKSLGIARDDSLTTGQIGMLVNLKGTEVAFSNLVLSNT
jgi:serine/threonine protein kinase